MNFICTYNYFLFVFVHSFSRDITFVTNTLGDLIVQHVLKLGHTLQPVAVWARLRELRARPDQLARVRAQYACARRRVAVAALPAVV